LLYLLDTKMKNMKKLLISVVFILTLFFSANSQENTLIIVHPTEYNLELFTYLIDNGIVKIDSLKIIGVYYEKETYDYSKSEAFLAKNNYTNIELRKINGSLSPNTLFQNNSCTASFTELFVNSDGIFFFGGPDLPPGIYNKETNLLSKVIDPYRHYFEASFLFHLLGGSQNENFYPLLGDNKYYPIYAICLGMQTMNVATGGTLTQDIPSLLYNHHYVEEVLASDSNNQHRNYNKKLFIDPTLFSGNFHEIKISNQKPIVADYKENMAPLVYSNHHQAIKTLGRNLNVIARSKDGKVIEAVTHKIYPNVLGVQFHPEGTYIHDVEIKYRKNPNDKLNSGKQILVDNKSYQFHLEFWKTFSKKMSRK